MKFIYIVVILLVAFPGLCFSKNDTDQKTITRLEDPVVVVGKYLKLMVGVNPEELSLMAYLNGKYMPVPFQIDQRYPNGEYAYTHGKKAKEDLDPFFDENDELVFMIDDLGNKAPIGMKPSGVVNAVEIKIIDPVDLTYGWVYLFHYSNVPPRANMKYVDFLSNFKTNRFQVITHTSLGTGYILGGELNACVFDEGRIGYTDGKMSPDFLDRMKLRGKIYPTCFFPFDLKIDVSLQENLDAWIEGPVRVIYHGDGYLKIVHLKIPINAESCTKYYRNHMNWRLDICLPFKLKNLVRRFPLTGLLDFNENITGARAYTNANPISADIILDGRISKAERLLDFDSDCKWIAGINDFGGLVFRLLYSQTWSNVRLKLCLREDLNSREQPEDDPGEIAIGLNFQGVENVDSNMMGFNTIFFLLPHFKAGEENAIIKIHDYPVETQCTDWRFMAANDEKM